MVEDKIIIHENKRNYLLFIIGFSLCFLSVSMVFGYSILDNIYIAILQKNNRITFDILKFVGSFLTTLAVFSWMISIPGIIICFITGRKILVNKRFSIAVFVLLLVTGLFKLVGSFTNFSDYTSIYFLISSAFYLTIVIFLLFICIRNKILSKLLLISLIFFAVNNVIGVISPFIYKVLSDGIIKAYSGMSVSKYFIILNYLKLLGNWLQFAGFILCLIYLVRCVEKNDVFNNSLNNKKYSTLILVGPSLVVISLIYTIYLVCILLFTTI